MPSFSTPAFQSFWLLSHETLMISRPLSRYFVYIFFSAGIMAMHGGHQVAQKSSNTYFLFLNDDSESIFPCISGVLKSCAVLPVAPILPANADFVNFL